jgi:hypothetical protein
MRFHANAARASSLAAVAVLALSPGCNPERPVGKHPVHPVEGQVLFQGKPLAGAEVSFHPVDEAKFGDSVPHPTGHTDNDGRFRLTTYTRDDGAPVGSYFVGVAGAARPESESADLLDPKRALTKTDVLAGRYLDPRKSKLKAEVKDGSNSLPAFELK